MHRLHDSRIFRTTAVVLGLGETAWGILLGAIAVHGDVLRSLLVLGPGYTVTFGYWWRAVIPPDVCWRRMIWGASTLVQGVWLFMAGIDAIEHGATVALFASLPGAWWAVSFATSVYALFTDDC